MATNGFTESLRRGGVGIRSLTHVSYPNREFACWKVAFSKEEEKEEEVEVSNKPLEQKVCKEQREGCLP